MISLNERELCDKLYAWHKEGQQARRDMAPCPYPANSVASLQFSAGWLQEDLRLALIKASPAYAATQQDV